LDTFPLRGTSPPVEAARAAYERFLRAGSAAAYELYIAPLPRDGGRPCFCTLRTAYDGALGRMGMDAQPLTLMGVPGWHMPFNRQFPWAIQRWGGRRAPLPPQLPPPPLCCCALGG
jgi:hypothetical protein